DFARFGASDPPDASEGTDPAARFELVYAGAVTGLYLLDEIARFFLAVCELRPDAFLRILTVGDVREAAGRLESLGVARSRFVIGSARPEEVPGYLRNARAGLSFRKP